MLIIQTTAHLCCNSCSVMVYFAFHRRFSRKTDGGEQRGNQVCDCVTAEGNNALLWPHDARCVFSFSGWMKAQIHLQLNDSYLQIVGGNVQIQWNWEEELLCCTVCAFELKSVSIVPPHGKPWKTPMVPASLFPWKNTEFSFKVIKTKKYIVCVSDEDFKCSWFFCHFSRSEKRQQNKC